MWSWLFGGAAILAGIGGIFYVGSEYGRNQCRIEHNEQIIEQQAGIIAKQSEQIEAEKTAVEQKQADMLAIQQSMDAIARRSASVGSQLREALNATNLATCVLPDDVKRLRADSYSESRAAAAKADGRN